MTMTSAWRQVQGPSKAGPPVFLGPGTKVARNQMAPPDTAQRLLHHQIQRPFAVPAAGLPQHHQVGVRAGTELLHSVINTIRNTRYSILKKICLNCFVQRPKVSGKR